MEKFIQLFKSGKMNFKMFSKQYWKLETCFVNLDFPKNKNKTVNFAFLVDNLNFEVVVLFNAFL